MNRRAIVMTGPLPPAVGGMASVLGALGDSSLSRQYDLTLFETGKTTPENRSIWQGIAARAGLMWQWWKLLGKTPRPIAHIHTCSGFTFFLDSALLLLAKVRRAPVILHIHGARFDQFLDSLNAPLGGLARWAARRADSVVVLSDDWQQRLAPRLPGARLAVVANGVPGFPATSPQPASSTPRFLFLGNLCRRKGVHTLLDAVETSIHPWQLDLAGGEEEPGFTAWTRAEIEKRGLSERVHVLGPIVGEAKARLLQQADGFVLPSLAEGLPMALLEAMAARLPVVVTRVGAMPEVVRDGIEGYLIPPENPAALAKALDDLAEAPEKRLEMGRAASETCDRAYGVELMVKNLCSIYASLSVEQMK
jgi:glycosyltransferase involved in cell wall biosynthesis